MRPRISIITPIYNFEKFISQCITSVLNQTYQNWEMIIVDDASNDNTLQIISDFAKKDRRIKTIFHKTNWGIGKLAKTYNQTLKLAKGKYITILEGDDFWPKDKLEKQIKVFANKKVIFSFGNWIMTDKEGEDVYLRRYKQFNQNFLNNKPAGSIINLFSTLQFDIGSPTVIIKKDVLLKIGGFRRGKFYPFVDIPTYLELAKYGQFKYLDEILGCCRRTDNSSWFEYASQSETMGREEIKKEIDYFIKKNKLKINIDNYSQSQYLETRKKRKFLSVLLNQALYKNTILSWFIKMLLRLKFWLEYFGYKLAKL